MKLTMGRKAAGSPWERLRDRTTCNTGSKTLINKFKKTNKKTTTKKTKTKERERKTERGSTVLGSSVFFFFFFELGKERNGFLRELLTKR